MSFERYQSPRFVGFSSQGWCFRDDGELMALKTGGDFCSEHEQGIGPITRGLFERKRPGFWDSVRSFFGKKLNSHDGIDSFRVSSEGSGRISVFPHSGYTVLVILGKCCHLGFDSFDELKSSLADRAVSNIKETNRSLSASHVSVGWSKTTLVIAAREGSHYAEGLKGIAESARSGDLIVGGALGDQLMCDKGGIGLYREKVIPYELFHHADSVIRSDQAYYRRLYDISRREGIENLKSQLRGSGKDCFYLEPRKFSDDGKLLYWLNPVGQGRYRTGLFTIEELRLWLRDEGPILY